MADINVHIDFPKGLTLVTIKGELAASEILDILEQKYPENPTQFAIWDVSQADVKRIREEDLVTFIGKVKEMGKTRENGKTIIISSNPLGFGIGRMHQNLSRALDSPVEVFVVKTMDEALEIIGGT